MAVQRMTVRLAILFLILGTTTAWSQRHKKPETNSEAHPAAESKIKPRYSGIHKAPHSYILEEDDKYVSPHGHHGGGQGEEYVDSEDHKSFKEDEETQGAEHTDKNIKDDAYNDHSSKSGHQDFKQGGLSFDKHLKDHKADNKEVENVKEHDVGEKYGGEAVKEHKLGKNKEKSKGHKVHGFKNVYHKEEYGDHKTFHDEFLDSDHQHNYDDQHEHKEMHGGKFSKGFKHEGKNKKYDKGDEKHEWGKAGLDGHSEGKHESGGQLSKHRHGSKKQQAQYDTSYQGNKNAVHKVKKGDPPIHIPHVAHHGPHQAQIEPYVSHHNSHHQQVHVPSHHSHGHVQSHEVHNDDDLHGGYKNHGNDHAHEGHLSTHGGYAQSHGGHHGIDNHKEYTNEEDDHDSDYQERVAKTQHRAPEKEQIEDKSDEKSAEKQEPLTQKLEPLSHQQPLPQNYGIQQYRQPIYQEQSRFQKPEYMRQERLSHPFDEKMQTHKQRIRYGFQPRDHHHQSHHHYNHQPHYHHHRLHHHPQHQQQPFPRFTGFGHHHHAHGHHQHDAHKKHFRHTPVYQEQSFKPVTHSRKAEHQLSQPEKREGHPQYSQRYE